MQQTQPIATTPPTVPPTMAGLISGYRQKELTESQSFDWTGLHQHHTLHTHYLFTFTIAQDNICTNNKVELLINYWALLCAVSWQQIHTSAGFHTLYGGWYMLVSHTVADPLLLRCQKGLVHSIYFCFDTCTKTWWVLNMQSPWKI